MSAVVHLEQALIPLTCWAREGCGVNFAIPQTLYNTAKEHGVGFYCPRGHHLGLGESYVTKLERELESERKRKEWAQQDAKTARRAEAIARGKLRAQSERVSKGVCPCCKRSFQNLRRHMAAKHPAFGGEE